MNFLKRFFTLTFITTLINAENVDFLTIHRYLQEPNSPRVTTEIHRIANGIGLPLRNSYNYFIDSVEGMPSLECSPATEECKWTRDDDWRYTEMDLKDDDILTIKIEDKRFNYSGLYNSCDTSNGGCQVFCSMQSGNPKCSCPDSMSLQSDNSCEVTHHNTRIVSTTGRLNIERNFPQPQQSWYFIPPGHTEMSMDGIGTTGRHFTVIATEFNKTGQQAPPTQFTTLGTYVWKGSILKLAVQVTSQTVRSRFRNRQDDGYLRISGNIKFLRKHLTLRDAKGTLSFNIIPVAESVCVSVIYMKKYPNAGVELKTEYSNGTVRQPSQVFERQIGKWTQRRFLTPVENANISVRLILEVNGQGTILYSILGCSPYGNTDVTIAKQSDIIIRHPMTPLNSQDSKKCFNGGKFNENRNKCVCLTGFTGDTCREGCGANFYGDNCTSICSDVRSQCKGMVFCKTDVPCHCASGYSGDTCTRGCEYGQYGVNCNFQCGHCNGACDIYTGLCHSGCNSNEYYPPYCVSTYKYPAFAPEVIYEDLNVVTISTNTSATIGEGNIKYYQVQYKQVNGYWEDPWIKLVPQKIGSSHIIKANITTLKPGRPYHLKIVFIDNDGNSYQGPFVPFKSITKTCSIPSSTGFVINHTYVPTGFQVNWTIVTGPTDCAITGYAVTLRKSWHFTKYYTSDDTTSYAFRNLLPGARYIVNIKAITAKGDSSYSKRYYVTTQDEKPSYVTDLRAITNGKRKLQISWSVPRNTGGRITSYIIKCECVKYMTCLEPCNSSKTYTSANETSVIVDGLQPHAVYVISVAGVAKTTGPFTQMQVLTDDEEPDVVPEMHNNPVVNITNSSATVQWMEPGNCSLLNGFMMGYRYELLSPNNTILREGETKKVSIEVANLTPTTTYITNVYVVTSGGWNKKMKLSIHVTTKSAVPEKVQSLSVYKRGRTTIGLRWKLPINLFGKLRGFSVSSCETNKTCPSQVSKNISPTPCQAWPDYFCYDVNNLVYNTTYNITVRAGNKELDGYGAPVEVRAVTSEGVPDAPLDLSLANRTETSVTVKWKPPFMFNGILRSFLINIEHQDSANSTNCCKDDLIQEDSVKQEREFYLKEFNELSPASTYVIGISARTTKIGASTFLSINTEPPVPKVLPPTLVGPSQVYIPQQEQQNNLTTVFVLLIVSEDIENSSVVHDPIVQQKMENLVKKKFYLMKEYTTDDLPATVEISPNEDLTVSCGVVGYLGLGPFPPTFGVGLAAVVDYKGTKNVGYASIRRTDGETSN